MRDTATHPEIDPFTDIRDWGIAGVLMPAGDLAIVSLIVPFVVREPPVEPRDVVADRPCGRAGGPHGRTPHGRGSRGGAWMLAASSCSRALVVSIVTAQTPGVLASA
jgi:hypothetical protein